MGTPDRARRSAQRAGDDTDVHVRYAVRRQVSADPGGDATEEVDAGVVRVAAPVVPSRAGYDNRRALADVALSAAFAAVAATPRRAGDLITLSLETGGGPDYALGAYTVVGPRDLVHIAGPSARGAGFPAPQVPVAYEHEASRGFGGVAVLLMVFVGLAVLAQILWT